MDGLVALAPQGVPRLDEVSVNRAVVGFAVTLSLVTAVLSGALPAARRAARRRPRPRGREAAASSGVAAAASAVASSWDRSRRDGAARRVGPPPPQLRAPPERRPRLPDGERAAFRVSLPESAYAEDAQRLTFHDELQRRLGALPGVSAVGAVAGLPLGGNNFNISFTVDGRPEVPPAQQPSMEARIATSGYFRAIGIPVQRGRSFTESDGPEAPQVVVLSESAVRRYFSGEEPIGRTIRLGLGRGPGKRRAGGEVVGVVGDVKESGLGADSPPEIYVPYAQFPIESMDVVLRTSVEPRSLAAVAERVVHGLDAELPVARVATLDEILARSVSEPRFSTHSSSAPSPRSLSSSPRSASSG